MNKVFGIVFLLFAAAAVQAENLLVGDTSVETEGKYMTNGTWTPWKFEGTGFVWDSGTGYDGRKSIRVTKPFGVSLYETAKLPDGKYVFSFYAKADKDNIPGFICCSEFQRSLWPKRIGKRKPIVLGREWKRYSVVFTAYNAHAWVPEFGLSRKGDQAWFDAFQLEKGTEPTAWKQPDAVLGLTQVTTRECNVWHPGEKMVFQAAARVKEPQKQYSFLITGIDWNGKQVFSKTLPVKPDAQGFYSENFEFPTQTKGWFRIDAKLMQGNDAAASDFMTVAVVCEPVPTAPGLEPFGGAAGGNQKVHEAMRRIGVGWLEWCMSWEIVERRKGQYDYKWLIDYDRMEDMKKKGFFNKVIYSLQAPPWEYSKEETEEARKLKLRVTRYFPFDPKSMPRWRAFVADSMKRYGKFMDLIEVGGELDASYGLSIYFKKKYPQYIRGNYVYGPLLDRYVDIFRAASDEILRYQPHARLSSMRPSDVDARHEYAYTETVLTKTGNRSNWLGLDCYPQPRWVGPHQPPTGHAALLLGKNVARAREIMKKHAKGDNIFISEYGYFIDYLARHELKYQREQANRLATSLVVARANGAKSFFWYTVFPGASNSHEANRYLMSISDRNQPFMGIPAYSAAVELLSNVVDTKILKLADDLEIYVFKKHDGSATAAVWSVNPEYTPLVSVDVDKLRATDMMGVPLNLKNGWNLSEDPCYFWRNVKGEDNFSKLCSTLENIRIREKLPVNIDIRQSHRNELKVIMSNKSRTKTQTGTLAASGKNYPVRIPPGEFKQVIVWCPAPEMELTASFKGYEPCRIQYRKPPIVKIPKVRSFDDAASFAVLKVNTPDHIEPVDHTTWSGPEDLSFELKLGHDADNLYLIATATDDRHYNKFDGARIWKGDCLQLGIDPQTNSFGRELFNPDDYVITFALAQNKSQWAIHEGPNKLSLKKYSKVKVIRDDKTCRTVYYITLPLRYIDRTLLKPKVVFGLNAAFFDDDSNSGADYWIFNTRGLAGKRDCSLYQLFELD